MSVECPASGCDYTGTLDAVEGHIGGSADGLHEGVTVPDLRGYLPGEGGGEGGEEASEIPLWLVVVAGVVVLYLLYRAAQDGQEQPDEQDEQDEQAEQSDVDLMEVDWSA